MASIILATWWFGGYPHLFQKLIELVEPGIIKPGKAAGAAHFCWLSLKGAFLFVGFSFFFLLLGRERDFGFGLAWLQ